MAGDFAEMKARLAALTAPTAANEPARVALQR
jgi:hypothetical protein